MKKSVLIILARSIKHYNSGNSSYYCGASDALCSFLEANRYYVSYRADDLVIFDFAGREIVRV